MSTDGTGTKPSARYQDFNTGHKSWSGLSGSRFARLENLEGGEECDVEEGSGHEDANAEGVPVMNGRADRAAINKKGKNKQTEKVSNE